MLHSATAQPLTHVLLIDGDAPESVRELGNNTHLVSQCYRHLLLEDSDSIMASKYRVILATPEASKLAATCDDVSGELKAKGIFADVETVKAGDMFMWKGKVGLLSCLLWRLGGSVLLNEVPISEKQAEKILLQANRFDHNAHHLVLLRRWWLQQELGVGLLRTEGSIGHLLRGTVGHFSDPHSVLDILRAMKANCSGDDLLVV